MRLFFRDDSRLHELYEVSAFWVPYCLDNLLLREHEITMVCEHVPNKPVYQHICLLAMLRETVATLILLQMSGTLKSDGTILEWDLSGLNTKSKLSLSTVQTRKQI